jgi:hypothetical protein
LPASPRAWACHRPGTTTCTCSGPLFGILDKGGIWGARGTVLAKVLHRKRPAFIPLYDEQVRRVYQDGDHAPVPPVIGRAWRVRLGPVVLVLEDRETYEALSRAW